MQYRPPASLFGSQQDQKPDNHLEWPNHAFIYKPDYWARTKFQKPTSGVNDLLYMWDKMIFKEADATSPGSRNTSQFTIDR